jgi:tRNA U34 5-methylaminomethyl-2-thiouridine-forming methyltransferase MnmC
MLLKIQPKLIITSDGSHTLQLEECNEHYHSTFGAIAESMHVYIENGMKAAISKNKAINILEIGFGTGLNAFLTIIEATNQKVKVNYTTIEPYPLDKNMIDQLNYPQLINNASSPHDFYKIHQAAWNKTVEISPFFLINKINNMLQDVYLSDSTFNVIYFDAFAPDIQPELWTVEVFKKCYQSMKNNSVLMTYSAKGSVKRALKSAGFEVQNIKGPIGKREITKALKQL